MLIVSVRTNLKTNYCWLVQCNGDSIAVLQNWEVKAVFHIPQCFPLPSHFTTAAVVLPNALFD